ncbi:MAG: glutamine-hydrolyzing carbamoyl-phosphate synthase small subunit [Microthrixaceae bacterium]
MAGPTPETARDAVDRPVPAQLVVADGADGALFEGELIGARPEGGLVTGEIVFNTVMSGYQEVITDPSYAGQIITFTTAHLGNYGVNPDDDEAPAPMCRGVVLRQIARRHSNWRATDDLGSFLGRHGISAIGGVDTRRLTRLIREHGALPAAFGTAPHAELAAAAAAATTTDGCDLVTVVTPGGRRDHGAHAGAGDRHVVAVDCGMKATIVDRLRHLGRVTVVPSTTTAHDILAMRPDGVFVSNGPGDPAAVTYLHDTVRTLLGRVPIFGICMGHQVLATALGGRTHKLPFGHHGGNHPIRELATGRVEITSQNHNYCVDLEGVPDVEVTHVNLNDGTLAGFRSTAVPAFGIQYHPEAGPGPHDSRYLFERFADLMDAHQGPVVR